MANDLSLLYPDLLTGSYDCIDRIVLNAYFRRGHSPGGFRQWWRQLTGSDESLDNAHLMRLAGRFSRRVRGWARAHQIPVIVCSPGDRKHEIVEEHLKTTRVTRGVFLALVSRAQAPVWEIRPKHHLGQQAPCPLGSRRRPSSIVGGRRVHGLAACPSGSAGKQAIRIRL